MRSTRLQKLRIVYMTGKNLSVASIIFRSFIQEELQLNQLEHKQFPLQIHFATLTHDNKIKPAHYLVKHETVLPSEKDDCHLLLADLVIDQFSIRISDKGKNIIIKPLHSFIHANYS